MFTRHLIAGVVETPRGAKSCRERSTITSTPRYSPVSQRLPSGAYNIVSQGVTITIVQAVGTTAVFVQDHPAEGISVGDKVKFAGKVIYRE